MMIPLPDLLIFAGASLLLVLTPGPNMLYLLSRSVCQGRRAGVVSLLGVMAAFGVHMILAAVGLAAVLLAVPLAYDLLRWAGAAYLLVLAWQAVRPGAVPLLPVGVGAGAGAGALPPEAPWRLFLMGFLTNLLNPKVALFYLSLFPQFVDPLRGSALGQSVVLGLTQIAVSGAVNLSIVLSAATLAGWFAKRPGWLAVQRYVMGTVLAALAARLLLEKRPA